MTPEAEAGAATQEAEAALEHVETLLDDALEETFPASDPVQPIAFT